MRRLVRVGLAACHGAVAIAGSGALASAQEVEGGWEGRAGEGFAYINWLRPTTTRRGANLVVSTEASHLYYAEDTMVAGRMARYRSSGVSLAVGVRREGSRAGATLTTGVDFRHSAIAALGASSTRAGVSWAVALWGEPVPGTVASAVARASGPARYRWGRVGVTQRLFGRAPPAFPVALALGVELSGDVTDGTRSSQAGGVAVVDWPSRDVTVELRNGASRSPDLGGRAQPYWGVSLFRAW